MQKTLQPPMVGSPAYMVSTTTFFSLSIEGGNLRGGYDAGIARDALKVALAVEGKMKSWLCTTNVPSPDSSTPTLTSLFAV